MKRKTTIPAALEINRFKQHIEDSENHNILFSAPFGAGKTTFLRKFFEEHTEFNYFHVFPVNYSIAENQDIFSYIKCSLILQILENRDINIEDEIKKTIDLLPEFIKHHKDKVLFSSLRSLLSLVPKVGGNLLQFTNEIEELTESFKTFKNEENETDLQRLSSFTNIFINKEGSIYEDNIITQIIRQSLSTLKLKSKPQKQNVLIIDDLDRIDPEHIFRILNIFSAHFDSTDLYENNKFGFDKIIIVADCNNLETIFHHKYGENTDFTGYLNKFFSKEVFRFDILLADKIIENLFSNINNNQLRTFTVSSSIIIKDLYFSRSLSLREILQLDEHLKSNSNYLFRNTEKFQKSSCNFISLISTFNILISKDEIVNKLKNCKDTRQNDEKINKNIFTNIYPSLVFEENFIHNSDRYEENTNFIKQYRNHSITYTAKEQWDTSLYEVSITKDPRKNPSNFSREEFYELLISLTQKLLQ